MKRDFDFIRELLLRIEGGEVSFVTLSNEVAQTLGVVPDKPLADGEAEKLEFHLHLLEQAGFIEVRFRNMGGHVILKGLTWQGFDFLDAIRDPEVWKKTKEGASKVGGWTFGLLKDMGTAYLKHAAKERLGLDL